MTMVSKAQSVARTIYKATVRLPISRNLMGLYTAKEGTRISNVLNRVLGTEDALARIALFRSEDEAYQVARAYLNSRYSNFVTTGTGMLNEIANGRTDDCGSASLLFGRAMALLEEAGYDVPVVGLELKSRWNASSPFGALNANERGWLGRLFLYSGAFGTAFKPGKRFNELIREVDGWLSNHLASKIRPFMATTSVVKPQHLIGGRTDGATLTQRDQEFYFDCSKSRLELPQAPRWNASITLFGKDPTRKS